MDMLCLKWKQCWNQTPDERKIIITEQYKIMSQNIQKLEHKTYGGELGVYIYEFLELSQISKLPISSTRNFNNWNLRSKQ